MVKKTLFKWFRTQLQRQCNLWV